MIKIWKGLCSEAPRFAIAAKKSSDPYVAADISNLVRSTDCNATNENRASSNKRRLKKFASETKNAEKRNSEKEEIQWC